MKPMSHASCLLRCCCPSWTCTPHAAGCPALDDWSRPDRGGDRVAGERKLIGAASGGEDGRELLTPRRRKRQP